MEYQHVYLQHVIEQSLYLIHGIMWMFETFATGYDSAVPVFSLLKDQNFTVCKNKDKHYNCTCISMYKWKWYTSLHFSLTSNHDCS